MNRNQGVKGEKTGRKERQGCEKISQLAHYFTDGYDMRITTTLEYRHLPLQMRPLNRYFQQKMLEIACLWPHLMLDVQDMRDVPLRDAPALEGRNSICKH